MAKYLSGRVRKTSLTGLSTDRYRYLNLEQAEPDLGDPLVGPSSFSAKPVKPGNQYIVVAVDGYPGERFWIPNQGGLIPGSISIFDESNLVGGLSSTTQLDFRGSAIRAEGLGGINPGYAVTITVFAPGNDNEIIFNDNNEFSSSSKLTFDNSSGLFGVGVGGTVITATGIGSVGIGSTRPTQKLDINGSIKLTGTIYDYLNQPGQTGDILSKNSLGGVLWINQSSVRAGAGGTYQNVQFHNSAGLVDGAATFVYDEVNSRVGIGSTIPQTTFDVIGYSRFRGQTEIDYLNVTGVSTIGTLGVTGLTTTRDLIVYRNLSVNGITTLGFLTGTNASFSGIVTAQRFRGALDVTDINASGVATVSRLVVTGLTTTVDLIVHRNLLVNGIATFQSQVNINNLNVTGVGTFDNIKLDTNTVSTTSGNLIIDSTAGTTQINDIVYVNDTTQSTTKDNGSIYTEGGVGIEKNLNVGGSVSIIGVTTLASAGGITTTGGDLYVGGDLFVKDDVFYDELNARRGEFTDYLKTKDFEVTGIATIANLGVTGLTTSLDLIVYRNFKVNGISTLAGAYIDNIQIGISGDNKIDTSIGSLILDSNSGFTQIDDALYVSGISTFNGNSQFNANVTFGNAITDTVSFTSRINTNVLPSATSTYDLGSDTLRWNTVYANTFSGQFVGIADSTSTVSTGTTTGTSAYYPTFVDSNNSTRTYEFLYTDAGISYNPSTDLLSLTNLTVSGISTFNGNSQFNANVTFGNAITDTVSFTSRINSNVLPSATSTYDLGSDTLRWNNIYANTFSGQFVGIADSTSTVSAGTTTGNASYYPTFVDSNNSTRTYEFLYTDAGISYNPSTDLLSLTNLTVSETSTFNGNVTFGNATSDTVSFTSRINSNVLPSATDTYDLGSISNRWNTIYANTFSGAITGNADTASRVSTGTTTGVTQYYPTFVDSNNSTRDNEFLYTDAGISYNPSTDLLSLTNLTVSGISTFNGNVVFGDATSDTVSFTSRINTNVLPSANATYDLGSTSIRWNTVYANTFSGQFVGIADSTSTVSTGTTTGTSAYYPTFVDSNNSTRTYEFLYTDAGISYNPSTDLLSLTNLTVFGNTIFGDATSDTVSFTSRINTNVLPSANATYDLGSTSIRWNTVYANNFSGAVTGNADTASRVSTGTTTGNALYYPTFVDSNNSTRDNEFLYTDEGVSYNPSTDFLSLTNLEVSGISTFNGNVTFGDAITDTVSFTSRINSNVLPSAIDTYDLGSISNRWNTIYANTFSGAVTGNADTASRVSTGTTTGNALYYPTFVDSNNTTRDNEFLYTDEGVSYNPFNDTLSTINLSVSGNTTFGDDANIDTVSFTSRINTNVLPSATDTYDLGSTSIRWNTVYANNFSGAVTGNADTASRVSTGTTTGVTQYYPTFVDSNNSTRDNEFLYTDAGISYNPSTDLLSLTNLTVSGISTFNGNTTFGDATSDTVSFTSRINSNVLPSANATYDLGSTSIRWDTVYANTFSGAVTGNADTASRVSTGTTTGVTQYYPTFVDSNNSTRDNEFLYTDVGISYNPSTNTLSATRLNVSDTLSSSITSILTRGADNNFQLSAQNGVGSNSVGAEVSRFGIYYSGVAWNSYLKFIRGGGATDGSIIIGTNNTDRVRFGSDGNVVPLVDSTYDLGSSSLKWRTVYADNLSGNFTGTLQPSGATAFELPNTAGVASWIKLGTFAGSQTGQTLAITVVSHNGYNALTSQNQYTILYFKTSNGSSNQGGFYGDASAVRFSNLGGSSNAPSTFRIVQESLTSYAIYGNFGSFTGLYSTYTVQHAGGWTHSGTLVAAPAGTFINIIPSDSSDLQISATNQLLYQVSSTNTAVLPQGTSGQVLQSNGTSAPSWINPSTLTVTNSTNSLFTSDLSGGTAGDIVYQSAPSTTAFLADPGAGGNGYILTWDNANTRPAWTNPTSVFNSSGDTSGSGPVPIGSVFYFASSARPNGYLICNGALLSTATYANLFAVIGYTFGGSGTSFNLPDLRGEFIRGWDGGRNVDIGRVFGSFQTSQNLSHIHSINDPSHRHPQRINDEQDGDGSGGGGAEDNATTNFPVLTDFAVTGITINSDGGNESRPRNIALLACIKY